MPSIPSERELIGRNKPNNRSKGVLYLGDSNIEKVSFSRERIFQFIIDSFELNIPDALEIIKLRYQILCVKCHKIKTIEERQDYLLLSASNLGCIQQVRKLR